MTLKLMQGFESMRDDTDFRAQNWIQAPTKMQAGFPPSISAVSGTALKLIGAGSSSGTSWGASGAPDIGYFNTGITANAAYQAGGFTLGFNARFNSGNTVSYGAGIAPNGSNGCAAQACFDGSLYWAVQAVGSTYSIATSPDLVTWTKTASQPAQLDNYSTVNYAGSGVVAVIRNTSANTTLQAFYTSNLGVSWSTQVIGTQSASGGGSGGCLVVTGNSSFPHAVFTTGYSTGAGTNYGGVYVGTLGGTFTQVVTVTAAQIMSYTKGRLIGGVIIFPNQSGSNVIYSATASNAALNTGAAWSTASLSTGQLIFDINYNPVSNLWVLATANGIFTFPNSGAAGTPVAPTGTVTVSQRYSTVAMMQVNWNGTQLIATGVSGHIISSSDGITWSESGGRVLPVGTAGTNWHTVIYDGSRYVMFSDSSTGVVATTPDGLTNYLAKYVADGAEANQTSTNIGNLGIVTTLAAPASAGATWTTNGNLIGMYVGPIATTTRKVALCATGSTGGDSGATTNLPISSLVNYYEITAVPVAGTANSFKARLSVNGAVIGTATSTFALGSGTTDTTSVMILQFGRMNSMSAFDDVYLTLNDGTGLVGPVGPISLIAEPPATDVQDQWVKSGSAASNALTVSGPALSSTPSNYLTSQNPGDKDIYIASGTIPSGYVVKAVQAEAFFAKVGATAPVVNVGISSGGTESDSANLSVSGVAPTYLTQIYQNDPHGNVAWTNASANAAELVINHVS